MKRWIRNVLMLGVAALVLSGCFRSAAKLPVYGQIPSFQLLDQTQQKFGSEDLKGKVWVGDFIFTSCAMTCPLLTQRMKGIQNYYKDELSEKELAKVRIVSFSVDPERDTPERLAAYAKEYGADPKIWVFLTGPLSEVTQTVVQGFKISMGKVAPEGSLGKLSEGEIFDVVHGEKFVLVDAQGKIRGYYDSDRNGLKKILADLKLLLREIPA